MTESMTNVEMDRVQKWEPMKVEYLGSIKNIVLQGGGKVSAPTGDPGEPRKVRTQG